MKIKSKCGDYSFCFKTNCHGCYTLYKMPCVDGIVKSYFGFGFSYKEIVAVSIKKLKRESRKLHLVAGFIENEMAGNGQMQG